MEFPSDFPSPSPSPFQKVDIAYRSVYEEQESPPTSDSLPCALGLGLGGVASALTSNTWPLMLGSTLCAQKASAEFSTNKDDSKLKAHRKLSESETKYEELIQEREQESRSTNCPLFDFNNPFAKYSTPVGQPGTASIQVAYLGDLTGDGINEFAISDYSATAPGNLQGAGKVWGIKGGPNVANVILTNFLNSNGVVFYGPNHSDQLGFSMAALGNFTGTGYNAIVVGAPNNSGQPTHVYIVFDPFGNPVDFSNCDGLKCIKVIGNPSDFLGFFVAGGYLNKDNYTVLLAGDPQTPRVVGILGGPGPWPGSINSTSYSFVANGKSASTFGYQLAIGPQGFAVSAPNFQSPTNAGKLYYFKQNATFPALLDLNLDGTPNGFTAQAGSNQGLGTVLNIANSFLNDGTPDIVTTGSGNIYVFDVNPTSTPFNPLTNGGVIITGSAQYPIGSSLATGDFNGDGYLDIVTGMSSYTPQVGLEQAGGVAFIWGQPGGLPPNIDIATANSTYVYIAAGTVKGAALGTLVVNLGDIVGDGHQYVAVTTGTSGTGTVYILRSQTIPPTCPTTTTTSTSSSSSTTSPTPSSSLPAGAWAGIGIGAAVVNGGAVVAGVLALRHYQKGCFAQEDTSKPMQNNAYFKDDV